MEHPICLKVSTKLHEELSHGVSQIGGSFSCPTFPQFPTTKVGQDCDAFVVDVNQDRVVQIFEAADNTSMIHLMGRPLAENFETIDSCKKPPNDWFK